MLHLIIRGLFLVTSSSLLFGCGPMGWWNNPYGVAIPGYGPGYQPNAVVAEAAPPAAPAQVAAPTAAAPAQQAATAATAAATPAAGSTATAAPAPAPTPVTVIMAVVPAVREPQEVYDDGDCHGPRFVPPAYGGWRGRGYFGRGSMYYR